MFLLLDVSFFFHVLFDVYDYCLVSDEHTNTLDTLQVRARGQTELKNLPGAGGNQLKSFDKGTVAQAVGAAPSSRQVQ